MRIPLNARSIVGVVAVGVMLVLPVAAEGGGEEPFRFSPGQRVYIHAETVTGVGDPYLEQRLHDRFLEKNTFEITNKVEEADFVFHVYSDYRTKRVLNAGSKYNGGSRWKTGNYLVFAEGFAFFGKDYIKGFSGREDLRKKALWHFLAGSEKFLSNPERRSRKLVKTFHAQYPGLVISTPRESPVEGEFAFGPGQSVYVVAYQLKGPADVPLEGAMVKEFAQRKIFKPIGSLSHADFVFLVYSEYETWGWADLGSWVFGPQEDVLTLAQAFAVTREQFEEYELDLPMLRAVAHWQKKVGPGEVGILPPIKRYRGLVKQFHEEVAPRLAAK